MTLIELFETARARLQAAPLAYGQGSTNAHDEAAWLLLWRLGLPPDSDLAALAGQPIEPAQVQAVLDLIEQRIRSRQPAAYLTRQAWLQGVPFYVDERSIVPRSLIAELIAAAEGADCLDDWLGEHTRRVLDLCTGNASLAVLAALAWPEVQVDAADLSPAALAVARINVEQHGLSARVRLIESDGWAALPERYDLILCNPPYVCRASMEALPPEFRAEPPLALDGGTDGMDFIRSLLAQAAAHLHPEGVLVLEIGHERAHFERAFPDLPAHWLHTSAGPDAVLLLTRAALEIWQSTLTDPTRRTPA
jgi:ribosomal protein L3 glutamine methyltransferase